MGKVTKLEPRRTAWVRDCINRRCRELNLCDEARQRVLGRAFHLLRKEKRSAAWAIREAKVLAKRIADCRGWYSRPEGAR